LYGFVLFDIIIMCLELNQAVVSFSLAFHFFSHTLQFVRRSFVPPLQEATMTRRTSLAITLIVGGAGIRGANAFVPSRSLLSADGGPNARAASTGGRIAGTGTGSIIHVLATTSTSARRKEEADSTHRNRRRQQHLSRPSNGPLRMFVGFQEDRAPRNHELGLPGSDPHGGRGYGREDFRGIHSHDIPWREHMPNAANDDGVEAYPVLWQYAQNGNWNEVYTRILDHPEEAAYEINGWTPLHLLVAGNGIPAPLAVVRAVYAAHPDALHRRTDHYGRTPLDIAVRWNQPTEVIEFLADPTILELGAGDEEEEFLMLLQHQQEQLELPGDVGRPGEAASPGIIDANVNDGAYALGANDKNVFEILDTEPPQQQRAVGYEKPRPINTADGLDNAWASAAVSVNGNSLRNFADDNAVTDSGHGDYEASFGDNVYQQQRPMSPKTNRVQVVGPSYAERPSEAVSDNYCAPSSPPPEPEYVEPTKMNAPHDNYNSAAADEEAEYFAAIQEQYYGDGGGCDDVEEPTAEVETTTTEYVQSRDVPDTIIAPSNNDEDSIGMKPIEPEIVVDSGIEVIGNNEGDDDDEEAVRVVAADVILDDNQLEEEIYNKKIMEEVRLQQYADDMAVQEAQDRMKQRASSRASWGNWGARHGHSWMNK